MNTVSKTAVRAVGCGGGERGERGEWPVVGARPGWRKLGPGFMSQVSYSTLGKVLPLGALVGPVGNEGCAVYLSGLLSVTWGSVRYLAGAQEALLPSPHESCR